MAITVIIVTTAVFRQLKSPLIEFAKGKRFFNQGRNLMAVAYLSSASAVEPENQETLLYLASAYDKLGRRKDTLKTLEAVDKINGKDLKIKKWLADAPGRGLWAKTAATSKW